MLNLHNQYKVGISLSKIEVKFWIEVIGITNKPMGEINPHRDVPLTNMGYLRINGYLTNALPAAARMEYRENNEAYYQLRFPFEYPLNVFMNSFIHKDYVYPIHVNDKLCNVCKHFCFQNKQMCSLIYKIPGAK